MIKYFIAFLMLICNTAMAQHVDKPVVLSHYVFDSFRPGRVDVKSGEAYNQALNYNIITGEMIFDANGKYLAIKKPEDVDTIYIDDRKFIPVNKKFYEVLANTKAPLLIEYTCTINEPGASTGYGTTTTTTATTSLKSLISSGGAYDLKLPDDFKVIPGYTYWIVKDGKYQKANNAKQIAKIFPEKKSLIDDVEKKKNTSFSKKDDVIALVKAIQQ